MRILQRLLLGFFLAPEPILFVMLVAIPLAYAAAYYELDPLTSGMAYAEGQVRLGMWTETQARGWLAAYHGLTPEFDPLGYVLQAVAPLLGVGLAVLLIQHLVRRRLGWKLRRWESLLAARNWQADPDAILAMDDLHRRFPPNVS
jgi:hypothetical protein